MKISYIVVAAAIVFVALVVLFGTGPSQRSGNDGQSAPDAIDRSE
ncbi:MAG: hypothetical protein QHC90_26615 [Shinella sp.]|nr:hypothetical protein [Shinella sp.]